MANLVKSQSSHIWYFKKNCCFFWATNTFILLLKLNKAVDSVWWMMSDSWSQRRRLKLQDQGRGLITQSFCVAEVLLQWERTQKASNIDIRRGTGNAPKHYPFNLHLFDGNESIFYFKKYLFKMRLFFIYLKLGGLWMLTVWETCGTPLSIQKFPEDVWVCFCLCMCHSHKWMLLQTPPSLPWNRPFISLPTGRTYLWSQRKMFLIISKHLGNIWWAHPRTGRYFSRENTSLIWFILFSYIFPYFFLLFLPSKSYQPLGSLL